MSRGRGLAVIAFLVALMWRLALQASEHFGQTGLLIGLAAGTMGLAWAVNKNVLRIREETQQEKETRIREVEIFYRVLLNRFGPWLLYTYALWKLATSPWPFE